MNWRVVLLALCVAACGPAGQEKGQAEAPDPFDLNIEVGRYGVMLSQIDEQALQLPGPGEPEVTDPRYLSRRLRETVWEYNLERSQLCARGLYTEISCGPVYEPVWMAEPDTLTPSLEDLQIRSTAVGAEVMRLWNAVCEDARSRVTDEEEQRLVCAME